MVASECKGRSTPSQRASVMIAYVHVLQVFLCQGERLTVRHDGPVSVALLLHDTAQSVPQALTAYARARRHM